MVELRDFADIETQKKWIDENIISAFDGKEYKGKKVTLKITNPKIEETKEYQKKDQKKSLLENRELSRKVYGDLELVDNETGKVLERKKKKLLARAPYHTGRGSTISNGSYYIPQNQSRLRPGAYTRTKENGEIETHFNLVSGTGSSSRINLDPEKGIFNFKLGTTTVKLYPLLKAMGATDDQLKGMWGEELFNANKKFDKDSELTKLFTKLDPFADPDKVDKSDKVKKIVDVLNNAKMDPEVNEITLGKPHKNLNFNSIIDSTKKIINISSGKEEAVDRDSFQYKSVHSIEDFYKEKIEKDAGNLGKDLLRKLDSKQDLRYVGPGYFTKQLWGTIKTDPKVSPKGTLAMPVEEINPIDMFDQLHKVSILGEGGVGDIHSVTDEARNVHPSQFNFIDYIRTPESANVGIDQRFALGVKKGKDNQVYKQFINVKTGKKEWLSPLKAVASTIAFPNQEIKGTVSVIQKGREKKVPASEVQYKVAHDAELFSTFNNMIPNPYTIQGNRMILAGKGISTAMPLVNGEAPLVRSVNPYTNTSFEEELGKKYVARMADIDGTVTKVTDDNIFIKGSDGKEKRHGVYNKYPLNLKTFMHNIPVVKEGDKVKKGTLIAKSNFTDDKGLMANGVNLKSAWLPYKGLNFEDGIVVSESAAKKKLASEQMYTYSYDITDPENQVVDKNKFLSMFRETYTTGLQNIDSSGVIKKGSKVNFGDPIILSMEKKPPTTRDIQLGNLHRSLKNIFRDTSQGWDHTSEGIVTDVTNTGKTIKVLITTMSSAQVGDKLTGRFGNKGVISKIVKDSEMPRIDDTGEPIEIIFSPAGIPSRINPGQVHEGILGDIARKTGKDYEIKINQEPDMLKFVDKEKKKHKHKSENSLFFPDSGRKTKPTLTGTSYVWKLSKMSEGIVKAREIGGYSVDEQPIKGKGDHAQAMKTGTMEVVALIGHDARHNLREMSTIKGQKNTEFISALKRGLPLPTPKSPFVYDKFLTMLEGAGINTVKDGNMVQLMPMTDKEILKKSSGEILKPDLLYSKNLLPISKGLFDPGITGGTIGNKYSHIRLTEPLPNPVMEDTIKSILNVNGKQFDELIEKGEVKKRLNKLDLDQEIKAVSTELKDATKSKKNDLLKKMKALNSLKAMNVKPSELAQNYVSVIPPIFRPVSLVGSAQAISPGNANLLYKDLMVANKALEMNKEEFDDEMLKSERKNLYSSLKAVTGLGEPINIQNKSKGVKGFISEITGTQPKTGFFQNKVYSKTQDLVGRGVAVPDPALNIDQIGISPKMAWKQFGPFVQRRMSQAGIPMVETFKEVKKKSPRALEFLKAEMKDRPIIMNRNPSLHKYNVMAFEGVLTADDRLEDPDKSKENIVAVSPPIVGGFNLDFDGDQVNLHVPVTPEAIHEARDKLLPSKNLFHIKDHKVHYVPEQEAVLGLYYLSKDRDKTKKPLVYNNIEEVKRDWRTGKISHDQPIKLLNKI